MTSRTPHEWPRWLNLIVPGAGLVAVGHVTAGMFLGLAFALAANLAVVSSAILPDDFPLRWQRAFVVAAATTYILAQFLLARAWGGIRLQEARGSRREALCTATIALSEGRPDDAFAVLQAFGDAANDDLLLLLRVAQAATARGDIETAIRAWKRLGQADRHRIYRRQVAEALALINDGPGLQDQA